MKGELVKISPKGQLVVPRDIRIKEKFEPSDRFVAFGVKGGVLFKRVNMPNVRRGKLLLKSVLSKRANMPDVRTEFESLSDEIAKQFKERKVKEKDINEAIKWSRQKRH